MSEKQHIPNKRTVANGRLDTEHQACPCCGGELHLIGETVNEMLDHGQRNVELVWLTGQLAPDFRTIADLL